MEMDVDSPPEPLQSSQQSNTESRSNSVSPPSKNSSSNSASPSSTTSSNGSPWRAIYRLKFGAVPVNENPSEQKKSKAWTCSKQCKKKNQDQHQHFFTDSQALEKHIMRCHPDPIYNKFVCIWCDKTTSSPQQILDHLGQSVKSGGHAIMKKIKKNEMIRAVHNETGNQFRVKRATNEFAWYICVPLGTSPRDSISPSPIESVSSIQDNQIDSQASPFQVDSSNQSQSTVSGSQNLPSGRPPDVDNGRPPDYDYPDFLMSGQPTMFGRKNKPSGKLPDEDTRRSPDYDFPDLLMTDSFSAVPG